jgi:2',3'-cyclic-nucleotide 2'-phosphodiesterase
MQEDPSMRLLFLGDIVGNPGVELLRKALPGVIEKERLDLVIANGENASGGSGITPRTFRHLRQAGIDLMTLGDHVYKKYEIGAVLREDESVCRPANFPAAAPGRRYAVATARDGTRVAVLVVLGRTFMRPVDCPFKACDEVIAELGDSVSAIVVDVHAEATADKYLLGHHLKGRVAAVLGTHTHIQTADEQVMPGGTAFLCDVGMTGPYDSILGRRIDRVLATTLTFVPNAFDVAEGDVRLSGAIVEIDTNSKRAVGIQRYHVKAAELANGPMNGTANGAHGANGSNGSTNGRSGEHKSTDHSKN